MEKHDDALRPKQRGIKLQTPFMIVIATAIAFFLVIIFVGRGSVISLTLLNSMDLAADIFGFSICFSIFVIQWVASRYTKDPMTKFIGSAFFTIAFLHLGHAVSSTIISEQPDLTAFIWIVARFMLIAALLFASLLPTTRLSRWITSGPRILVIALIIATIIIFPTYFLNLIPSLMLPSGVLTDNMIVVEYIIMTAFAIGAFRYWQLTRETKDSNYLYIMSALIVAVFGEFLIALYNTAVDLSAFIGYVFILLSFLLILEWLVRSAIRRPYQILSLAKTEIEEGRDRAQAYLDFLCHDTANILAPVRSYAEVIANGTQSDMGEVRKYAAKIMGEADRASSLTRFLRRLSVAEKELSGKEQARIELGETLREAMETVRRCYPYVKFDVKLDIPRGVPIYSTGKGHVGEIIEEILCMAAKYPRGNSVSIEAKVGEKISGGRAFWQTQLSLHNLNLPKELDLSVSEIFDSKNRMRRGVISDMSIYASIIRLIGGRLWVEDWKREAPSTDLTVFLDLPKIQLPNAR